MNLFLSAFYKLAVERKQVATCGVVHDGKLLMGKRRDNGKWTTPGGHLDPGEMPVSGAQRELMEEAGMTAESVDHLETRDVDTKKGPYTIHAYKIKVSNPKSTMKYDPDAEVQRWHWLDISKGLSEDVLSNLHSPDNVLLQAMGLQPKKGEKSARRLLIPSKDDFLFLTREGLKQGVQMRDQIRPKKRDGSTPSRLRS